MKSTICNQVIRIAFLLQLFSRYTLSTEGTCNSKIGSHSVTEFRYFSCAWCYDFLFSTKHKKLFASERFHYLLNPLTRELILPDITNQTCVNQVCHTLDNDECTRWQSCCSAAEICCQRQLSKSPADVNSTCMRTWDGWGCWEDARPGEVVYQSCPLFLQYSVPSRDAVKTCLSNASWEMRDGYEWTNYQPCLNKDDLKTSIYIGFACSLLSIAALFPAIVIFLRYKALRKQHRIMLHINFFVSLLLKEVVFSLWDMLVTFERITNNDSSNTVLALNGPGCKILSFIKIYSKATSFTWMFCEGFYLHRLMSDAFSPPSSLIPLYVAGWGMPFISTSIYAVLRLVYANESCWSTTFKNFEWIFDAPNLACLLVNFIFLCNILRILVTQLQSHPNEPSHFRRAVKATFVLIPLFGVQLFVTIYRIPTSTPGGLEYERFSIVVNNLQGFCVALIFCFLNHEVSGHLQWHSCLNKTVLTNLRRTWRRRVRDRNSPSSRRKENAQNITTATKLDTEFTSVNKPLCESPVDDCKNCVNTDNHIFYPYHENKYDKTNGNSDVELSKI